MSHWLIAADCARLNHKPHLHSKNPFNFCSLAQNEFPPSHIWASQSHVVPRRFPRGLRRRGRPRLRGGGEGAQVRPQQPSASSRQEEIKTGIIRTENAREQQSEAGFNSKPLNTCVEYISSSEKIVEIQDARCINCTFIYGENLVQSLGVEELINCSVIRE